MAQVNQPAAPDAAVRQKMITRTSVIGIAVNLLIAAVKIVLGLAASSLAIVSEGVNNASDAATSLLTLAGTKLSAKHPDEKHPFGYGRVEYLTGMIVSFLILYTGISLLKESVEGILHPAEMTVSVALIIVVAVSAVIKFCLGLYTIRAGKQTGSSALVAVGLEGRNDSVFSLLTIAVTILYLVTGLSLDAWAGIVFAAVILKAGVETLTETAGDLIGRPGKRELARTLYREIRRAKCVKNVADMMLHDYGPDAYSGSVNIEVNHDLTIGEVYQEIHALQLRIMQEYHVTLVFGIYAVDYDSEGFRELHRTIAAFVVPEEHVKSYHALYLDREAKKLYCDLTVDYALQDWDALTERFAAYLREHYPEYEPVITIETAFV